MTGFYSKRKMAQDKAMTRPVEAGYTSQVAYTRALEAYCDSLAQPDYRPVKTYHEGSPVYVSLPKQEQWLQVVTTKIEAALLSHRLSLHNDVDDDGVGFPLVDALCCGQTSLDIGKREVEDIAEAIYHVLDANTPPALAAQPKQEPVALDEYDAGLLSDYGGGNVEWWQDYIRAELGRAYAHYQSQTTAPPLPVQPVQEPVEHCEAGPERCPVCAKDPVQLTLQQQQLKQAHAERDKADADLNKAYADWVKAYAEVRRIEELVKENI